MTKRNCKKNKNLLKSTVTQNHAVSNFKMDISSKPQQKEMSDDTDKTLGHIFEIRIKLDDPSYIEGAIYRLATVITNRILKLRGEL